MSSDLIFPILPREGKSPMPHDEQKVQRVSKEAKLRRLNDEEKELNAEEREARKKQQKKGKRKKDLKPQGQQTENKATDTSGSEENQGPKHLDIYV